MKTGRVDNYTAVVFTLQCSFLNLCVSAFQLAAWYLLFWEPYYILLVGCSKSKPTPSTPTVAAISQNASAPGFPEEFETGTKTAYTTGGVALASGS